MSESSSPTSAPRSSVGARLQRFLFEPVDVASIAFFRIAFGAIMVVEVLRYFAHGWVRTQFAEPRFRFSYEGFSWVQPWPGDLVYLHFALLGACALLIAVGRFYRCAAGAFCLGMAYVFLLDQANYLNHFYLICLVALLLVFVPAQRAFSLDARKSKDGRGEYVPAWCLHLLRAQIGIAYVYGGLAKLNQDWLRGEPMRMWLEGRAEGAFLAGLLEGELAAYFFSYGGLLLDLFVVPALLWRRTRLPAFGAAVVFHLMNDRLFSIGIFPWMMIAATTLFFDPDWPRRLLRLSGPRGTLEVPALRLRRATTVLLATYVCVQLLVPLRHHLYPGNVSWTEEGHRFAWHMKLRDKRSDLTFVATDPELGETWAIRPRAYLTPRQYRKMSTRPELIRKFCHLVAAEEERVRGKGRPEVRARVETSLNGRPHALLVDPTVDLAAQAGGWGPAEWIMPLAVPPAGREVLPRAIEAGTPVFARKPDPGFGR